MVSNIRFNRTFSDVSLGFTKNPVTKDVTRKLDEDAIKASIKNIIFTDFYERPFEPDFGSGVTQLMFENFGEFTESRIRSAIKHAIQKYEPRALINSIDIESDPDNNRFAVTINFSIINIPKSIELSLFLERIR